MVLPGASGGLPEASGAQHKPKQKTQKTKSIGSAVVSTRGSLKRTPFEPGSLPDEQVAGQRDNEWADLRDLF